MEQTNWGKYIAVNNQEYTRKLPRRKFSSLRGAQKKIWVCWQTWGSLLLVQGALCQTYEPQNRRTINSLFWPLSSWWFVPAQSGNYCRTHFSRPAGCQDHSFLTVFLMHRQRELSEGAECVWPSEQSHSHWPALGIYSVVLFATAFFLFL